MMGINELERWGLPNTYYKLNELKTVDCKLQTLSAGINVFKLKV